MFTVTNMHPTQIKRLDLLKAVMQDRTIDRGDTETINTLSDAIAHLTLTEIRHIWDQLHPSQQDTFIWVCAIVCSVDSLVFVVKSTIQFDQVEKLADIKIRKLLDAVAEREANLTQRETLLTSRENLLQRAIVDFATVVRRASNQLDNL